jgi:hypothetical protein
MPLTELERLQRLAAYEPVFGAPDFSPGRFARGASADVVRFSQEMADLGWSTHPGYGPWMQTPEGRALIEDDSRIQRASPEELALLLTAIFRTDRFNGGTLDAAFSRGTMLAIARRARVLAWTLPNERPATDPEPTPGGPYSE